MNYTTIFAALESMTVVSAAPILLFLLWRIQQDVSRIRKAIESDIESRNLTMQLSGKSLSISKEIVEDIVSSMGARGPG